MKPRQLLWVLHPLGYTEAGRQGSSHRWLVAPGRPPLRWAFYESVPSIGAVVVRRIPVRDVGLTSQEALEVRRGAPAGRGDRPRRRCVVGRLVTAVPKTGRRAATAPQLRDAMPDPLACYLGDAEDCDPQFHLDQQLHAGVVRAAPDRFRWERQLRAEQVAATLGGHHQTEATHAAPANSLGDVG